MIDALVDNGLAEGALVERRDELSKASSLALLDSEKIALHKVDKQWPRGVAELRGTRSSYL